MSETQGAGEVPASSTAQLVPDGRIILDYPQGLGSVAASPTNMDVLVKASDCGDEEAVMELLRAASAYEAADPMVAARVATANARSHSASEQQDDEPVIDLCDLPDRPAGYSSVPQVGAIKLQHVLWDTDLLAAYVERDPIAASEELRSLYERTTNGASRLRRAHDYIVASLRTIVATTEARLANLEDEQKRALDLSAYMGRTLISSVPSGPATNGVTSEENASSD